jgi:hypothetical protein
MGQVKSKVCEYIPYEYPKFNLKGVHPDWEMHRRHRSAQRL